MAGIETEEGYASGCEAPAPRRREVRIVKLLLDVSGRPGIIAEIRDALTNETLATSGRKCLGVVMGKSASFRAGSEAQEMCRVFKWTVVST